ncbi:MAG: hypothetical protein AABW57_02170, partial [Nanoarchaeota archaeon]
ATIKDPSSPSTQKTLNVLTIKDYINSDLEAAKKFKENGYNLGGNFKALEDYLKDKKAYLTIQQPQDKTKYKTIELNDLPLTNPSASYEVELENNKLKTLTVDYNHYLEVERNSQGVITQVALWKKGYNGESDGRIKEFLIARCADELRNYGLSGKALEACNDLKRVDEQLAKDPKKISSSIKVASGLEYKIKGVALKSGVLECLYVMGAEDCKWLFSACDPVFCPVSRFTYNGYRVDNVVSSGIFGSIYLGLGLWRADIPPEVGICVPGILAGLKNIRSVVQGYEQCLLVKKEKGENVGICDTIFNIGICKVAWKEAYTLFNIKSGLLGAALKSFSPSGVYGGQEYAFFYENFKKAGDFLDFFTNEYATTFFNAFRGSSTQEIGDTICEYAIYGKLPGGGDLLDQLTRPEGPPQFIAIMDEVPHADIRLQQTSDYSVFYHIYAGESYPQIRYYVYLHDIDEKISPSVLAVAPRFGLSGVSTGYLNRGDFVSDTVRLSDLPTGYDEVCVVINNVKKCGFGKVSTDFGVEYLQQKVVEDQLKNKNITSERECAPDSSLTSQFAGASSLQISAAVGSLALGSGLTQTGIIRKCSIENPGKGKDEGRWENVGSCGKDDKGRGLGICWLDKNSYNLLSEEARKEITKNLEETNKLKDK